MDPEDVTNLFDSYWFHYEIFKKKQSFSSKNYSTINPSSSSEPRFSSLRSILGRSQSADMASFNYGSFSPNLVIQSIPSGKVLFPNQEQEGEAEVEANSDKKLSFSFSSYSKVDTSSSSEPRFSSLRSILGRSQSEDMASFNYGSFSPNSVLKSIPSGKLLFPNQEQEGEAEVEANSDKKQSFSFTLYSKVNTSSSSEPKFSSLKSILGRSQSEDMASFNCGSLAPNSMLKSIPSGKLLFPNQEAEAETNSDKKEEKFLQEKKKNKKRRIGMSKSLSDLEFEELKGFMDLGFLFSEEDKESSLVQIIPGLQRLGHEREKRDEVESDSNSFSSTAARRPYLSEAWVDIDRKLEKRENKSPLMIKWEVPSLSDEIDMKDNLKLWAHTVASIVR